MGIRQLQTYMQKHVPNGYIDYSIMDECKQYFKKHYEKPIIVVDLMGLVSLVLENPIFSLCGGRHNIYMVYYDNLMHNLSLYCELVFFLDGPVQMQKFDTWVNRQNDRYKNCIQIIDFIYERNLTLNEIVNCVRPASLTTHLSVIKHIAKKYGQIYTTVTKECDAEIARYACLNPRVIAVLADDSDFLIFTGNWKYLSIKQLDHNTLITKEYNRRALREHLQLNDLELVILSTLGGNDLIKFEEVEKLHMKLVGKRNLCQFRFPALAQMIKNDLPKRHWDLIITIARIIFQNTHSSILQRIHESLDMFNLNFAVKEPMDPLLKFCRDNHYDFFYSILNKMKKNFTLLYYDLRIKELPNLYKITTLLFRKQIGIILKNDVNAKGMKYPIGAKTSHYNSYDTYFVEPIFPPKEIPPLLELLQRQKYPAHDRLRFELLKWTLGNNKKMKNFDLETIPQNYFLDILVLIFLVQNKLIESIEADLILLTIKHVNINTVPEDLQLPEYLDPRTFHVSFLFTKIYGMVHRSLEVTGLKMLKKVINFDGLLFHNLYQKYLVKPFKVSQLLNDLNEYCLYR
ncbi:hypothetical protein PVAND_013729 [Polypedilum vanderplanki]|uniref:Constitutive coactivator of peroxisome proliferator-activated receptor gamma n=1 Tax=Polypedilum vanderplanki TaxID=319348 RepID=A0A9J6CSG3_POLVA|nr:hypothetical protein PVAND_013729 [Polypedilum vanderplanki]